MKKISLVVTALFILILAACGNKTEQDNKTIVIGAANVPHAEILEKAKPLLKKQGFDLKIKVFQDIVMPNKALADKEIDANYFQHVPYLESENKEKGYNLVNAGAVHIEPFGIYSKNYKKVSDIKKNATIQISSNSADQGRILMLLERENLITFKKGVNKVTASIKDIDKNPKNITFKSPIDPGLLPKAYENNEADLFAINTNYALDSGLTPNKDALILEGSKSPYVNIVAVRKGDENSNKIKKLMSILHSKEIQDFITDKYKGAVLPVTK